jgi:hypothetical protein
LAALLVGVAAATVGIPPLIARPRHAAPAAAVPAPASPEVTSAGASTPAATTSPPATTRPPSATASPGARPCAAPPPAGSAVDAGTGQPSCGVYTTVAGQGWQVAGNGAQLRPGDRVPGTQQLALRVEPQQPTAAVSMLAAAPVGISGSGHLTVKVYGGPTRGTVLRLSVSASTAVDGRRPVVLTAPADQWTTFTAAFADLLPGTPATVRRIDLVLAYDLMPNTRRFFIDGIVLTP